MPSAANAKLQYESGQTPFAMAALTDSGDHKLFSSAASLFSQKSGFTPDVRPNGIITGGVLIPAASAQVDKVDVSAITCYLAGVKTTVAAATNVLITRGLTTNTNAITSITVTSAGAIAAVAGTASTAFSETRGAAGGPPYIPVGSIEIGQVRTTSITAAVIIADEVFQVVGTHSERFDFPTWTENPYTGKLTFAAALPLSHTGDVAKKVYAKVFDPVFVDVNLASAFVPPETSHSSSSTQVYGSTVGSSSSTLNQGSFSALLTDGVSDALVGLKNQTLFFKFFPDRNKTPFLLCYGKLGLTRQFPADNNIVGAFTISAPESASEVVA